MENLDLDITNYSIKDITKFFKLKEKSTYKVEEIELRENQIREQLLNSGHINKRFKKDLIDFLDKAKKWLIDAKCEKINNTPSSIPKDYQLDKINNPIYLAPTPKQENLIQRPTTQFMYTQESEFLPGKLNPLNTRIITKCLNIDTRFRGNFHNTNSSDVTMQLPTRLNKVVSMELTSIELPISFYGISQNYGNNYLHLKIHYSTSENPDKFSDACKTIVIPDGNYTETDLIDTLNYMITKPLDVLEVDSNVFFNDKNEIVDKNGNLCNTDDYIVNENNEILVKRPELVDVFKYVIFKIDINENGSGSRRVTLGPEMNAHINIKEITLDFSNNINNEQDSTTSIYSKLGWNLGFTKPTYSGDNFYNAETIIEPSTKYLFLAIDDFNNNSNSNFISVFNQSIMNTDILARISIKGTRYNLLTDINYDVVSEPRHYFGPVDLQRLRIRLLDEHGRPLQMNNSNYSFCLKLKMLYDL
tara:strand:- start:733 stop:2154 length:1422 start_codon:yes stop_codon:yes gene_type:complete